MELLEWSKQKLGTVTHSSVAEYFGGMGKDLRLGFNLLFVFLKEENEIWG